MLRHKYLRSAALAAVLFAVTACDDKDGNPSPAPSPTPTPAPTGTPTPSPSPTPTPGPVRVTLNFAQGIDGWLADYTDYIQGDEANVAFTTRHERLPAPLANRSGYLLQGRNTPDDIFMFISKPVTGLRPSTRYRIDTSITFATNSPPECAGIGGAVGEAVEMKAGATPVIPARVLERDDAVRSNIDKGNQAENGMNVRNLGNIAQPIGGGMCPTASYQVKTLASTTANAPIVTSDATGRLWLVIGTDSGYEGQTALYYLDGTMTLTPQ